MKAERAKQKNRLWPWIGGIVVTLLTAAVFMVGSLDVPLRPEQGSEFAVFFALTTLLTAALLVFAVILARSLVRLWIERRSGQMGSRFKVKMVAETRENFAARNHQFLVPGATRIQRHEFDEPHLHIVLTSESREIRHLILVVAADDNCVDLDGHETRLVLLGSARWRPKGPARQFVEKPYHYRPLILKIEQMLQQVRQSVSVG